ncbi:Uncharacterised protein [Mycobacteroides abscessus subsp. abscessus]|nr:Uncharacterised protein [Mycobacteroides abscessus subsp. abscessus]
MTRGRRPGAGASGEGTDGFRMPPPAVTSCRISADHALARRYSRRLLVLGRQTTLPGGQAAADQTRTGSGRLQDQWRPGIR